MMQETARRFRPGRQARQFGAPGRLGKIILLTLAACLAFQVWPGSPAPAAAPQEKLLEALNFRVEYLLWKDVAQAQLTLTSLGPGHYRAEISGEPLGLLRALTGPRRDSYRTEMIYKDGQLRPLIYREETRKRGRRSVKEYRFNYDKGQLELWQFKEGKNVMLFKWRTELKGSIYDPLSTFYNCRLELWGPLKEGDSFKVNGIPYPKPEEIEVRIGPEGAKGRKVMITLNHKGFANNRGVIFAFLDEAKVPQQAWTDSRVGKISGRLAGGKSLQGGLPEVSATAN